MMKTYITLGFCALFFLSLGSSIELSGQAPGYVPTDGLVGWWPYTGNLLDQSNNGLHASNFGSTFTNDRFGTENSALYFDGDSWVQVTIPQTHAWSVSIWSNQLDANDYNGLVQHKNNCVRGGGWLFSLPDGSNDIRLAINNCGECSQGSCSSEIDVAFPSVVESTSWHHFVASRTDEGIYRVYLDGTLIHELTNNVTFETYGDQPFSVGKHHDGTTYLPLTGSADDVGLWNRALDPDEVQDLFLGESILGCTDSLACNYNSEANLDDGTCASCEALQTACGPGTIWDAELQMCIGDGSGDINLDGCVQLNDLLDLLSAYGNCGDEASPWQCGEPLEYQGYDYETVLIGDRCWFAENCRWLPSVSPANDGSVTEPRIYVYNYNGTDTNDATATTEYQTYGALYNNVAAQTLELCPSGWRNPSSDDWLSMSNLYGGNSVAGLALKDDVLWHGTNESGFSGLPGGRKNIDGVFDELGNYGLWWTGTGDMYVNLYDQVPMKVGMGSSPPIYGYHVRCIQDAE